MRNNLTATCALVLSTLYWPDGPHDLPEVFDAFHRIGDGISGSEGLVGCVDEGRLVLAHSSDPGTMFRATPILDDGWLPPEMAPASWRGHVTRSLLAAYFRSDWLLWPREPSWGALLPFAPGSARISESGRLNIVNPAKRPLLDPLRDLAAPDDPAWLSLSPELEGEWGTLLTPWEATDAYLGGLNPGAVWLDQRTLHASPVGSRLWWQLRGWRDADDWKRYSGQWEEPIPITVYLGWHAYAVAATVETGQCESCARPAIKGRRFCGCQECNRDRAIARQRLSRRRPRRTQRNEET